MKKLTNLLFGLLLVLTITGCGNTLPKPQISEGLRGQFGIDKNINEATIDNFLGREDVVYRDMRMLKDPGNYEAIDGDSYLSGFVKGFEVVPYPYLVNVIFISSKIGASFSSNIVISSCSSSTFFIA